MSANNCQVVGVLVTASLVSLSVTKPLPFLSWQAYVWSIYLQNYRLQVFLVAQYLHNEFHDVRSHVFDQKTTNHTGWIKNSAKFWSSSLRRHSTTAKSTVYNSVRQEYSVECVFTTSHHRVKLFNAHKIRALGKRDLHVTKARVFSFKNSIFTSSK